MSPGHPGLASEEQWSVCHPGLAMRDREMTTEAASEEQWSVGHPGLRGTAGEIVMMRGGARWKTLYQPGPGHLMAE